jgi:putative ABC transport system permease protein
MADGTVAGLQVGTQHLFATAVEPMKGEISPVVTTGRAPVGPNEIFLGEAAARRLHVRDGDTISATAVMVGYQQTHATGPQRLVVVGTGVTPEAEFSRASDNAFVTMAGLRQLVTDAPKRALFLVRMAPGFPANSELDAAATTGAGIVGTRPTDLSNFGRIGDLPLVAAALLATAALGMLVHALTTSVYRRRRELAIMKTVGMVRRQVRAVVAWQATTTVALGAAIGVPLGLGIGRLGWAVFAQHLGVVEQTRVPLPWIAMIIVGALVVANVIAAVPGVLAGRRRPAVTLAEE